MITIILSILGLLTAIFGVQFVKDVRANTDTFTEVSWAKLLSVGFVTDFMDTLGIGSFSPTTSLWKLGNMVEDRLIPGTMNVGHTFPVVLEAFLFITVIEMDPLTLVLMLLAATLGAVLMAGIVSKLPERQIKIGMGLALLAVAAIMLADKFGLMPAGGDAIGLRGTKLVIAVVGNFILGALMTIGIGLYAPCMALISMLGMSPRVSFPVMMGSCAFLMPAAGMKFVKEGVYDRKAAVALTTGGLVGVVIAHYIVKTLPMDILAWLVIGVIIYTAAKMLHEVATEGKEEIE